MTEKNHNNEYINPSAINLISKYIKSQNKTLLNSLCDKYELNESQTTKIIEKLNKPYYPNIVQKKNREYLQCLVIKELNL